MDRTLRNYKRDPDVHPSWSTIDSSSYDTVLQSVMIRSGIFELRYMMVHCSTLP